MLSGREKTFAILVLLFAASAASAYPTIFSDNTALNISPSSGRADTVITCNLGSNAACSEISELGRAILQPPSSAPADKSDGRTTAGDHRYLPAAPPAIAMVLTGFLCISLIRDRKAWLAVLAGILWMGRAGVNILPELTLRLTRGVHNERVEPTLCAAYPLDDDYYPESYNEQIRYAGLLRHLEGIPRQTRAFSPQRAQSSQSFYYISSPRPAPILPVVSLVELSNGSQWSPRWNCASQHAIVQQLSSLNTLCDCLVSGTRQFVCFTPAFIFNLRPRGPPKSYRKIFCKPQEV